MIIKHSLKTLIAVATIATATHAAAEKTNCLTLANKVTTAVTAKKSNVLELVSNYVSKNESCACEVVKAAITATDAEPKLVADITETAIIAAPDQMRLIGQCAVAVAPDAFKEVQAVLNTYSNVGGSSYETTTHSSKGSDKDAVASNTGNSDSPSPWANPLDLPLAFISDTDPIREQIPNEEAPVEETPSATPEVVTSGP